MSNEPIVSTVVPTGRVPWIRRHPVAAYLLLALPGSSALLAVLALVERGILPGSGLPARVGAGMEEVASLVLVLALLASAVVVTYADGGGPAVRTLLARAVRWRVSPLWWAIAVLALPVSSLLLALVLGDSFRTPTVAGLAHEAIAIVVALGLVNLGEETAWAGFLQTRLERSHRFLTAAVLTAVPFALVHLPIRVVTREIAGPADVVPNLVQLLILCVVIRTLFGAVLRGARDSVLLVAVTHTSFNRSNNVDGIVADLVDGDARGVAALLATLLLTVVLCLAVRTRPHSAESALVAAESALVAAESATTVADS